ncbi:MAG: hypothetical protein KDC34_19130 [Saprospiraceae bacterium]|nr:hypothetical protein [Saprospiraceae bacterium]
MSIDKYNLEKIIFMIEFDAQRYDMNTGRLLKACDHLQAENKDVMTWSVSTKNEFINDLKMALEKASKKEKL